MTENTDNATTLIFPASLASDATKGDNHVRIEIHELQDGKRINPYVIHLYYPIGFAVTDAGNYGTMDAGAVGLGMKAVLQGLGLNNSSKTELTSTDLKAAAAANAELASQIPGIDMFAKGARIKAMQAGIAQNPFTYVTYEGHQLRSFTMDFKLISESKKEAETIGEIINVIRNYSMPEATGELSIQYPAHFEIEFYQGGELNPFMPKIFTCHLTSLATTYNSTSNIFHADGAPLETDISLSFQEIKTLTRQDLYSEEDGTLTYAGQDDDKLVFNAKDIETKDPKANTGSSGVEGVTP